MNTMNPKDIEATNTLCDKFAETIINGYRESAEMGRHTGCRHCKCTWEYSIEERHSTTCPVEDAKAWKKLRK
jgi:hypothetical protein